MRHARRVASCRIVAGRLGAVANRDESEAVLSRSAGFAPRLHPHDCTMRDGDHARRWLMWCDPRCRYTGFTGSGHRDVSCSSPHVNHRPRRGFRFKASAAGLELRRLVTRRVGRCSWLRFQPGPGVGERRVASIWHDHDRRRGPAAAAPAQHPTCRCCQELPLSGGGGRGARPGY